MKLEEFLKTRNNKNIGLLESIDISLLSNTCRSLDIKMYHISGNKIKTKSDLMEVLSNSLDFPDYFGKNWDALFECLWDSLIDLKSTSWKGLCLVITEIEDFLITNQFDSTMFLILINNLEKERMIRKREVPIKLILDCDSSLIRNLADVKITFLDKWSLNYQVIEK